MRLIFCLAALALSWTAAVEMSDAEIEQAYSDWKAQQDGWVESASPEEAARRLTVFAQNLREVMEHNADPNQTYQMKLGPFAEMTDEEVLAKETGLVEDPSGADKEGHMGGPPPRGPPNARRKRATEYVINPLPPRILNQNPCGSCWAFSATAAMEQLYAYEKANGNAELSDAAATFSPQELVDCGVAGGCSGGQPSSAFKYAAENGLCAADSYAFTGKEGECKRDACGGKAEPIIRDYFVPQGEEDVERTLLENYACAVSADAAGWSGYKSGVFKSPHPDDGLIPDHNAVLVGFGPDYWLLQNSWGEHWGDKGFIKVARRGGGIAIANVYCPYLSQNRYDRNPCTTTDGKQCYFPFVYNNLTFDGCTMAGGTSRWCYTDGEFKEFGYCPDTCPKSEGRKSCESYQGMCFFPFVYHGVTHDGCTNVNADYYWCMAGKQFGTCPDSCPKSTVSGTPTCATTEGVACKFPFIYKGTTYNSCTADGSSSRWCATSLNADGTYKDYGNCIRDCP